MGNSIAATSAGNGLWTCGLSLADFEAPSNETTVAQAARETVAVALELAHTDIRGGDLLLADEAAGDSVEIVDPSAVGDSWVLGPDNEDTDFADRKVLWPVVGPQTYRPSGSVERRIEDNIAAIRLVKALADEKRKPSEEEMATLLRYSGWGGAARVFSLDGATKASPLASQRDELRSLVTENEYVAMQASVNTAFYTPPHIVEAMWRMVRKLGFTGGRVLEPAAGTGQVFASMPRDMARQSMVTAVEIDPITAAMLEANFAPYGAQVHACGLEKAPVPAKFWDLVISNCPFGDFKSLDTSKTPYADWSIHNWFLAKSLELVRPGGLVAMITTKSTLDSKRDARRKWMAAQGELVAAFRLPTMAFKEHANTEAVTDILLFKRREVPDFKASGSWLALEEASTVLMDKGQSATRQEYVGHYPTIRTAQVNGYFNRHPEAMLGRLQWQSSAHGPVVLPVFNGSMQELQERLDALIEQLPEGIYKPGTAEKVAPLQPVVARYDNLTGAMPGAFVLHNGRVCISEGDEMVDVDDLYAGTARKRLLGMLDIREATQELVEHQANSDDDVELGRLQKNLNGLYDAFVAKMGPISTTANSRVMRSDPTWPLLLALEIWDEEAETAIKADIFSKRTVGRPVIPDTVDSVKDALLISLALYGRIELRDMATRWRRTVKEVTDALREQALAFRDPQQGRWVPADEYLSGHIRDKIAQAKAAGPAYASNIPALEAVLPEDLGPADVEARLGAPWIPCEVIQLFCTELVNDKQDQITVKFEQATATWGIVAQYHNREHVGDRALQTMKWGTQKRCALELVESALNQTPPTVTMKVDDKQVVDRAATLAAREKWQAIKDEFRMWVFSDESRRDKLRRLYNDAFNEIVTRKYDGSHLMLPGMSSVVTPHGHQKNAIWRILVSGNTLLAHRVGAGKTLVMAGSAMELRRLGKARKPFHVVPNHCLEQYAAEFVRLYPQARVLIASKDDLCGDKRRTFAARIAMGDWDSVVMTQSTFERIPLAPESQREFLDGLVMEARAMLNVAQDSGAKRSIKEVEKRIKDLEARLERLAEAKADDASVVWFDELGCDWLNYDEGHGLKNLVRISKMPRIAGLSNAASQKAFDAFMKTRLIMRARGGVEEGVVMATATPISNSIAELHTMQVFLQPYTLKRHGLYEFDAWAASFGESVTGLELAPDGSGYRVNNRFCRFVNVPELMAIFRGVADIQTRSTLNLKTPPLLGGKPGVVVSKASQWLKELTAQLVERADKIRNGQVDPSEDNMLAVTNDGRKAALDLRLLDPSMPADPEGKLCKAADNIVRIWKEGARYRWTQLVFSDLGTPGGGKAFSVYEALKQLLIERGIPDDEIAFIQDYDSDAAKAKLFKKVREGIVRVVMGSTQKMGAGTNVQKRLRAVHQLDCPWRPSDVEQRDGRADRQGNECDEIELARYVTEGSFDAYSWNLIDVKARFIEQVMTNEKGLRTVEDVSMTALSYAEIKALASGNPLVLEKASVDSKVQKLAWSYGQWEEDRWRMSNAKAGLKARLAKIEQTMAAWEQEAKLASAINAQTKLEPLTATCASIVSKCATTAQAIGEAFRHLTALKFMGPFGKVGEFTLLVDRSYGTWALGVQGPLSGDVVWVERPPINEVVAVGDATLEAVGGQTKSAARRRIEHAEKTEELANIEQMLAQDFPQREELAQARAWQAEIDAQLDLDKNLAGTGVMNAETTN